MAYYEPKQGLSYFYNERLKAIFIESATSVQLPEEEEIMTVGPLANGSLVWDVRYDVYSELASIIPGEYSDRQYILIIRNFTSTGTRDAMNIVEQEVLAAVAQDLTVKKIAQYTVSVKVFGTDGKVKGQATNTISKQGTVKM